MSDGSKSFFESLTSTEGLVACVAVYYAHGAKADLKDLKDKEIKDLQILTASHTALIGQLRVDLNGMIVVVNNNTTGLAGLVATLGAKQPGNMTPGLARP